MSERYNVEVEDVLGENYKITNIEASDYNPTIDDSITVTITVNDVYGDAVSGESVTVTASEGTFTQLNGSDITSASSVTGTTNSSGQFTLTYNCSEWGLITFSANTRSTQICVDGYKNIWSNTTSNPTIVLSRNKDNARLTINGHTFTTVATTWTQYGNSSFMSTVAPTQSVVRMNNDATVLFSISSTGELRFRSNTGASLSNKITYAQIDWSIA